MITEFTLKDFELAKDLIEQEKVSPLTQNNMFFAAVYSLLSAMENFNRQMLLCNWLYKNNFNDPLNVIKDSENLIKLESYSSLGKNKRERIIKLSHFWIDNNLTTRIKDDLHGSKQDVFEIRKELDKAKVGLGYKCASLFLRMCGYDNIAPIDMWTLEFLKHNNVEIKKCYTIGSATEIGGETISSRGITPKDYVSYEVPLLDFAKKYSVSIALMQATIYLTNSTWKNATEHTQQTLGFYDSSKSFSMFLEKE